MTPLFSRKIVAVLILSWQILSYAGADVVEAEAGTLFWIRFPCGTDSCSSTIRAANGPAPVYVQTTTTSSNDVSILYGSIPTTAAPKDLTLFVYEQGRDPVPVTIRILPAPPISESTLIWRINIVVNNFNISQILDVDEGGSTRLLKLNEEFTEVSSFLTGTSASAEVVSMAYTNANPRNVPPILAGGIFPNWFLNRTINVNIKIHAAAGFGDESGARINCSALQQFYDWSASEFVLNWSTCTKSVQAVSPADEGGNTSTTSSAVVVDGSRAGASDIDWTRSESDFNETVFVSVIVALVVLLLGIIWITRSAHDDSYHGRETVLEHKRYVHVRNKFAFDALFPEAPAASQNALEMGKTRRRMTTQRVVKHVAFAEHTHEIPPSPKRPSVTSRPSTMRNPIGNLPPMDPPPYESPPGPHDESSSVLG